jgi:hypothetical protein
MLRNVIEEWGRSVSLYLHVLSNRAFAFFQTTILCTLLGRTIWRLVRAVWKSNYSCVNSIDVYLGTKQILKLEGRCFRVDGIFLDTVVYVTENFSPDSIMLCLAQDVGERYISYLRWSWPMFWPDSQSYPK